MAAVWLSNPNPDGGSCVIARVNVDPSWLYAARLLNHKVMSQLSGQHWLEMSNNLKKNIFFSRILGFEILLNNFCRPSPCPQDYLPLRRANGTVICYSLFLGGPRSHGHDWREAERSCRKMAVIRDQSSTWRGHLVSLPNKDIYDDVISLLQRNDIEAGILVRLIYTPIVFILFIKVE